MQVFFPSISQILVRGPFYPSALRPTRGVGAIRLRQSPRHICPPRTDHRNRNVTAAAFFGRCFFLHQDCLKFGPAVIPQIPRLRASCRLRYFTLISVISTRLVFIQFLLVLFHVSMEYHEPRLRSSNGLQGDPYGRGRVFVDCYFEVAF